MSGSKVGRNEPCPCGSGKKYKKCCGGAGSSGNGTSKSSSATPAYLNPSLIAQQWMASQQAPQEQSKIKLILDHYESSSEEASEALRALGKVDDEGVVLFYRKKQWFGEAVIADGQIVVTTAKKSDADDLKKKLEAIADVNHLSRKEDRFEGLESSGSADVGQEMKSFKVKFFKAWMDEPNERLEGSTPREATKVPALKAKLRNLVKELEDREAKLPKKERYSFKGVKKELEL